MVTEPPGPPTVAQQQGLGFRIRIVDRIDGHDEQEQEARELVRPAGQVVVMRHLHPVMPGLGVATRVGPRLDLRLYLRIPGGPPLTGPADDEVDAEGVHVPGCRDETGGGGQRMNEALTEVPLVVVLLVAHRRPHIWRRQQTLVNYDT